MRKENEEIDDDEQKYVAERNGTQNKKEKKQHEGGNGAHLFFLFWKELVCLIGKMMIVVEKKSEAFFPARATRCVYVGRRARLGRKPHCGRSDVFFLFYFPHASRVHQHAQSRNEHKCNNEKYTIELSLYSSAIAPSGVPSCAKKK